MPEFRHIEYCMGTAFQYWGRSDLDEVELQKVLDSSLAVLHHADEVFSLYKPDSPLSKLARGETSMTVLADEVNFVWEQCEYWEKETNIWFSEGISDRASRNDSGRKWSFRFCHQRWWRH